MACWEVSLGLNPNEELATVSAGVEVAIAFKISSRWPVIPVLP